MSDRNMRMEVLFQAVDKLTRPLKAIVGGSSESAKALKAAKDQLKALNDEQSRIARYNGALEAARKASAAYRDQKQALGDLSGKLAAAKDAQAGMVGAVKLARAEYKLLMSQFAKDDSVPGLAYKLGKARDELEKLEGGYNKAKNATRRLKEGMRDVQRATDAAKSAKDKQAEALKRLSGELTAAGLSTKGLDARQAALKDSIEAANAALEAQKKKTAALIAAKARYDNAMAARNTMASFGVRSMAAGAAVGLPLLKTVKEFAVAEDAATQLKVAMMGAGGQVAPEFERINELAMRLGNRLPGTTADFQNMMTMLIRQGMQAKDILGGLGEATAYLGVQLKLPMDVAAEFASQLQDATRTTSKDMMGLMDVIQKTFNLGVKSDYMLQGFSKLSPALSILRKEGLEASRALAPLLAMANQGGMTDGGSAGNAFRKMFQLSMDAKKVAKGNAALAGTGIRLDFTDGKGEFGGLEKMYAQLEKLKGLNTQQRLSVLKTVFGDDAETLQVLSLMIDKGLSGYREVQAKMEAQASLQDRVNAQLDTLGALWEAASGTFTNALVAIGETIAPELKALTKWINEVAEGLQNWTKKHPVLAGVLMKTAGVLAVTLTAVGALGIGLAAVAGPIAIARYGFDMAGGAIKSFGVALRVLAMNPIILAITGIAVAALLIYKYWEPIKAFFAGVWDGAKANFHKFIDAFKNFEWGTIGQFIVHGIEIGLDAMTAGLYTKLKALAGGLVTVVKNALGIKSPSRVFAEIGGFTMGGLEQGILAARKGPLGVVLDTAKRVSAAGAGIMIGGAAMAAPLIDTRPPLAAGAGGGSHSTVVNYTINITAGAGANEGELRRLFREELERHKREIESRRRSSLRDYE